MQSFSYQARYRILPVLEKVYDGALCKITPTAVLEIADDLETLWNSEPIQAAYQKRNTFQLDDSASYFLTQIHKIMSADYIPTDEDILHTRVRTVGIVEHEFELKDKTGPHSGKVIMVRNGLCNWH